MIERNVAVVNECLGRNDCHVDATCTDLERGYTCRCNAGFVDQSPNRQLEPGRICVPKPTAPPPECQGSHMLTIALWQIRKRFPVADIGSCNVQLKEVCRLINGRPKCDCPINYQRNP